MLFWGCFFFLLFYFIFRGGQNWREASMEYFMVPAQKVPSLQHFRKTEKEVIGGLCRYVCVCVCVCVCTRAAPLTHARRVRFLNIVMGSYSETCVFWSTRTWRTALRQTCLIRSVIVYTTHSRAAAGFNCRRTPGFDCVRATVGVRLGPQHPRRGVISHI